MGVIDLAGERSHRFWPTNGNESSSRLGHVDFKKAGWSHIRDDD
jgi:hypothetical protein